MGMVLLKGDETQSEIIALAYGMEQGLNEFYSTIAEDEYDPEVKGMLVRLAAMEEGHKHRLFRLYRTLDPDTGDMESFEAIVSSDTLEGGFTPDEFFEQNKATMSTVQGMLNVAMMLEAQAMDLYMRYSYKAEKKETSAVLHEIAEQEKGHLAMLGMLLDEKSG